MSELFDETLRKKLELYMKILQDESSQNMTFLNYDLGLGETKKTDRLSQTESCSNYEVGIIDQGIFQGKQLDKEMYAVFLEFLDKHKDNIGNIEVYYLSKNLVQPASFVTLVAPVGNAYHTGVGFIFKDKQDRVIRSAICQLELVGPGGMDDQLERWFAPVLCLFKVDTKDGAKDPRKFSKQEFADNLHLDFTRTVSSLMFNFLETEDYIHDSLVAQNSCIDLAEAGFVSTRLPSKEFFNQGVFRMQNYYDAYQKQREDLKHRQGTGDGTIFELAAFGPTPLSSTSGYILHFSTLKKVSVFQDLLSFLYVTYGNCSEGIKNSDMETYIMLGIDKVYPTPLMSNKEMSKVLELPTVYSTDNGFIREMRGRVTHCNIHVATIATLLDTLSKTDENIEIHTDFESKDLQRKNAYAINPLMVNLPIVKFAPGYEYGVDMHTFNNDIKYQNDKMEYARLWFVLKKLVGGMNTQAVQGTFSGATDIGANSIISEAINYALTGLGNNILQDIYGVLFGKDVEDFAKLTAASLIVLVLITLLGELDLYEHFYILTGPSTRSLDGEVRLTQTDGLPTVWKFPLKENKMVIDSYVKSIFSLKTDPPANKTAGEFYAIAKENEHVEHSKYMALNRFVHPLPLNKFYLWTPGLKWNNTCSKVQLQGNLFLYVLKPTYKLVKDSSQADAMSLSSTTFGQNLLNKPTSISTTLTTVIITLVNIILIVVTGLVWRELEQNKIFNSCVR